MKRKTFDSKHIRLGAGGLYVPIQHLHLDIQSQESLSGISLEKIEKFILDSKYPFKWSNFDHPTADELIHHFKERRIHTNDIYIERFVQRLVDPARNVSPLGLLTGHYCGPQTGKTYDRFNELERLCQELMRSIPNFRGYLEKEHVWFREEIIPEAHEISIPWSEPDPILLEPWKLISLEDLSRPFRQSEYHLTFEDIALVNPQVLDIITSLPHYLALKKSEIPFVKYSLVATVQGFSPEIEAIMVKVWSWVRKQMLCGRIKCPVVIKPEYIQSFYVCNAKHQLVVEPRSIV